MKAAIDKTIGWTKDQVLIIEQRAFSNKCARVVFGSHGDDNRMIKAYQNLKATLAASLLPDGPTKLTFDFREATVSLYTAALNATSETLANDHCSITRINVGGFLPKNDHWSGTRVDLDELSFERALKLRKEMDQAIYQFIHNIVTGNSSITHLHLSRPRHYLSSLIDSNSCTDCRLVSLEIDNTGTRAGIQISAYELGKKLSQIPHLSYIAINKLDYFSTYRLRELALALAGKSDEEGSSTLCMPNCSIDNKELSYLIPSIIQAGITRLDITGNSLYHYDLGLLAQLLEDKKCLLTHLAYDLEHDNKVYDAEVDLLLAIINYPGQLEVKLSGMPLSLAHARKLANIHPRITLLAHSRFWGQEVYTQQIKEKIKYINLSRLLLTIDTNPLGVSSIGHYPLQLVRSYLWNDPHMNSSYRFADVLVHFGIFPGVPPKAAAIESKTADDEDAHHSSVLATTTA